MWVPLVECCEADSDGANYFVAKDLSTLMQSDPLIDTIILGCTHYPLLLPKIAKYAPEGVTLLSQGHIVADSLADYLHRHPEMEARLSRGGSSQYLTTDDTAKFNDLATLFLGHSVSSQHEVL